ncbi:recombinase family protein [Halalkalibacter sp. AB-rgal2]|uniref:recombinase family protein n=1 Tax=Halalkalibacter sp. AB-rgal2 TaxID=3242695 RepID=UPI00359DB123
MLQLRPTGLDIFIYLRKSRKDIESERKEGGDTLQRHRKLLLEVVKKENHNLVSEPFEEVVSGEYIIERPEIQRMLKEVENGAVDAVLVVDLDRLGRGDMYDMGSIYRTFSYSETLVLTPTDVIDPTQENSELMFGVKSIVSREELKSINKRLQNGRRASAKEGKFIGKQAPFGYKIDQNLKLVPDPETAPIVKIIFEKISEGLGRHKVARYLEEVIKANPPSKYQFWDQSSISYIIKNEVYKGNIIWGKTKQYKRNGKRITKKLPREKWIIVENAHEAVVPEELFREANNALSARYRTPTVQALKLSNPLATILRCSICDRALKVTHSKDRPNKQVRCETRTCAPFQKGALLPIVYDKLIESLESILESITIEGELVKKQEEKLSVLPGLNKTLEHAEKDLALLEKQKTNLHDLLEQGVYDIETFMERQNIIVSKMKQLQQTAIETEESIKREMEKEKHYSTFLPRARSILETIKNTDDPEHINKLLKSIVEKVVYTRKKDWKEVDKFKLDIHLKI